jgi:hypothetical protein
MAETEWVNSSLAPWLSVRNGRKAVDFYRAAFGAVEVYGLETDDEMVVVRLAVQGAGFWAPLGDRPAAKWSLRQYLQLLQPTVYP